MKHKILSLLVLLLTAATGAWATDDVLLTTIESKDYTSFTSGSQTFDNIATVTFSGEVANDGDWGWYQLTGITLTVTPVEGITITRVKFTCKDGSAFDETAPFEAVLGDPWTNPYMLVNGESYGEFGVTKIEVYGTAAPAIEVTPVTNKTNEWEFDMPASDVVLTPVYSAATVYTFNGQAISETPYETLKEAFAKVKDGDIITLDWDVTLTEQLQTPTTDGGVKFTLDFNGYTIDGGNFGLSLMNQGDQLTFTDSSDDQMGGLKAIGLNADENAKFIFDAGRYKFGDYSTAEFMNAICANNDSHELSDGKEFVDIANGPDADDFNLIVAWKAFELAIGPKEFDTFYADKNIVIDAETAEGINLYTITAIDIDRSEATLSSISGTIAAGTPMLVYNSTEVQKLVKIKMTAADASTAATAVPEFKGTAVAREFTADDMTLADYYALSGGKAFAYVKNAGTIAANQCWLQFDKPQGPGAKQRAINIVFEEGTTGLEAIDNGQLTIDNEGWYDLNGRKLDGEPTTKGVFIKNGKKVMK
jgi:hypothetical protein